MNKNVYTKQMDEGLLKLVTSFQYVPYKLNKYSKHKVGHTYWDSFIGIKYDIVNVGGNLVKVSGDGYMETEFADLDIKNDYELIPYEFMGDVINSRHSYRAAEIKALIYTNMITDEEVIKVLMEYFTATHVPNDYNYYFIRTPIIDGVRHIKLKRDLKKCPHNFYNIKTLADVYKDPRIALYEFVNKTGEEILPEEIGIPAFTNVLVVDHIAGAKYRIILDM